MVEPETEHRVPRLVFSRDADKEIYLEELARATVEADELQTVRDAPVSWRPRRHGDAFLV